MAIRSIDESGVGALLLGWILIAAGTVGVAFNANLVGLGECLLAEE